MQGRLLHLWVRIEGLVVNLINVYAPISGPERLQFYQQASAFLSALDAHECLVQGGDFNTTLEERDRSGIERCPAATDTLREIVEHHSLVDIWRDHHPDDTSTFTFVRVEAHRSSHSRLDRIYLSRFHLSRAHSSNIRPAPFSDHHLATVTASLCAERPGPAYWHFNNSLLEDEGFVTSFREFWLAWRGQRRAFPLVRRWWDLGKSALEELPTVSASDRDRLELPLTLAEFSEALRRMPTNKSPGMDGLTVEFYRVFWDVLGPDLVTVWAKSLQSGVLPLLCRRAVLALLPKKGDLRDLRNWCPVSLLSTDYKIVGKAISLRLGRLTGLVLREPELQLVLLAYADDVLLVIQDPGDLAQVEAS
ncbi:unnamed protein product [Caretta caretta]